jgi:hypothetical protein
MALTEIIGSRPERKGGRIYFTRKWEALKTQVVAGASGWVGSGITLPAYGDALGITSMTWTNAIEPRLYDLELVPHHTRAKTYIVGRYSAPLTQGAASGTLIELYNSQDHGVNYKGEWQGYRRYACPDADALTHRATLQTTTWTINSVAMRPTSVHVEKDPQCPGVSLLVCYFHWIDNPAAYQVGRATLEIKDDPIIEELTHGVDANGALDATAPICVPDATEPYYWKLVQGSNKKKTPRRWLILKAGFATANLAWSTWEGWADKLNASQMTLTGYPTIAAKTLKFHTAEVPAYHFLDPSSKVVPVRFVFEHRPNGFPACKAQKFVRVARKEYAVTENDNPNGVRDYMKPDGTSNGTSTVGAKYRLVWQERKVGAAADRTIQKAEDADFTSVYNTLVW